MDFIIVYVTHENQEEASKVINHLLDKQLIACANTFPITSFFFWNNEINNENEVVSILKTKTSNRETLKNEILKVHPYDTPCIIKFDVEANQEFGERINNNT